MLETLTLDNLVTLGLLILLQAVLGFDNLLYVSIESQRAPADRQSMVRKLGIGLAVAFRIGLLLALVSLIRFFERPFFEFHWSGVAEGEFNVHSVIVLFGGAFILYTATREILHMMTLEEEEQEEKEPRSVAMIIFWIVAMNLVFSFDSILSAMALSDVFWVMAAAIVAGGVLMIVLADRVSEFLKKNRMYEVLGLFVLFVVGVMLVTEGGHLAHLVLFGNAITPMTKTTFYFVLAVLVMTDVVQGRYRKKLQRMKQRHGA